MMQNKQEKPCQSLPNAVASFAQDRRGFTVMLLKYLRFVNKMAEADRNTRRIWLLQKMLWIIHEELSGQG